MLVSLPPGAFYLGHLIYYERKLSQRCCFSKNVCSAQKQVFTAAVEAYNDVGLDSSQIALTMAVIAGPPTTPSAG